MIEKEEEELLLRMVGFRSVVLHGYAGINLNAVDSIVRGSTEKYPGWPKT